MVDRAQNLLRHLFAGAVVLVFNTAAIMAVAVIVAHFVNAGAMDDDTGFVVLGLFSGAAVSVITAIGYGPLKMAFGVNTWQKGVDEKLNKLDKLDDLDKKLDALLEGQEKILKGQEVIISLLMTYLPVIAASLAALAGTPVPPPPGQPTLTGKPSEPAPSQNVGQGGVQGSGGTAHMWRSVDGGQPRSL